ncbi:MAG: porin [Massilia sp.]|nr:porin [Massilia sp.]
MNKTPIAASVAIMLAAVVPNVALAQSSVTIYGLIDAGIEHVTNIDASGRSVTRMPNLSAGAFPSRIGFRGSEDLGDGLKAVFTLENGFGPDTGTVNQGGRLFGRQAWVGLASKWGTVTLGRNYSMMFNSFYDVDVIGPSQYGVGTIDAYLPNARSDNSIAYRGVFSGTTIGATYSLGRDASAAGGPSATNCAGENAADAQACRNWSAMLRHDGATWGALVAYDTYNGGVGAAAPFSPTLSSKSDSRLHAAGYAKFGVVKIAGGWLRRKNEASLLTPDSDLAYIGTTYNFTDMLSLDAQVARLDVKNSPNDTTMVAARANYALSKRSAVYLLVAHQGNKGNAAIAITSGGSTVAGAAQNGVLVGMRHSF